MFSDLIVKISKRFYPKSRAFRVVKDGNHEKLHKALAVSEDKALSDAIAVQDSMLPDNPNFTSEDASDWERRLGLITNTFVSLDDRKKAIARKIQHPGTIKARQHYLYLQKSLQDAGFDVYIYENRFPLDPLPVGDEMGLAQMGLASMNNDSPIYSGLQVRDPNNYLGGQYEIIANFIPPELDEPLFDSQFNQEMEMVYMGEAEMGGFYDFEIALRSSFYVMGSSFPSFATVAADRKDEFRQMILRLKPAHTYGFIYAEYTGDDFNNDFNQDFNAQN